MKNQGNRSTTSNLEIIIFISMIILFQVDNLMFINSYILTLKENPLQVIWNSFFLYLGIYTLTSLQIIPIWKFIFVDTNKIGKKIEWYGNQYQHLTPDTKKILITRWVTVIFFSVIIYSLRYLDIPMLKKYSLSFSALFSYQSPLIQNIKEYFSSSFYKFSKELITFNIILWITWSLESRTRVIARLLITTTKNKENHNYEDLIPPNPWRNDSNTFNLTIFTKFINKKGNDSESISSYEEWLPLKTESLKCNLLVIGPIGSQKTTGIILPSLEQFISWNADNELRLGGAIYDPKGDLTDKIKDIAISHRREQDLLLLSIDGKKEINIIQIDDIWHGQTAWKISGWLLAAYRNFSKKSSPEPYWEGQTYVLIRMLLIILYSKHGKRTTIYDLSKLQSMSSSGVFKKYKDHEFINDFGLIVFKSYYSSLSFEEASQDIQKREFDPQLLKSIPDEVKSIIKDSNIRNSHDQEIQFKEEILNNDKEVKELFSKIKSPEDRDQYNDQVNALVSSKLSEKLKNINKLDDQDILRSWLLMEIKKDTNKFHDNRSKVLIKDAFNWFITSWNGHSPENRGSIVSTIQPFLMLFETPEIRRVLSSKSPNIDFSTITSKSHIFVPHFANKDIGSLASGIITLIKSRWQESVLNDSNNQRPKFQVIDEAQQIITFSEGDSNGDFEYMELSRSFGGMTILASQSLSALKAKSKNPESFKKIHGLIRSIVAFGTNDETTIKYFQSVLGKSIKKRLSKTVLENSSSPELDFISEKYKSSKESNSISISYTESEALEDRVNAGEIQGEEFGVANALIFDGRKSKYLKLAIKPSYWPAKRDKWTYMKKINFDTDYRRKDRPVI